ncbi:MAG: hypothetical protein M0002_01740 [Rhodospirillales bacterium]|nr:hypothetical protein [Rhodospirillales bacterium]
MRRRAVRAGRPWKLALLAAVLAAALPAAAAPAPALDPNWPCEQIKIEHMSLATMWGGPPLGKFLTEWQNYPAAAALAQRLSERRIAVAEAQAEITAFARKASADRKTELLALMGGLFSLLDQERFAVVQGLDRFGARQKSYAAQIRTEITDLHDAQDAARPDQKQITTLSNKVYWDTHVFSDRRSMISYACFVPDEIERRLYQLAGTISNLLP